MSETGDSIQRQVEAARKAVEAWPTSLREQMRMAAAVATDPVKRIEELERQVAALRSDLAKADQALRDGLLDEKLADVNYALNMENDALRRERDMLRKDAERYRLLRRYFIEDGNFDVWSVGYHLRIADTEAQFDNEIDDMLTAAISSAHPQSAGQPSQPSDP